MRHPPNLHSTGSSVGKSDIARDEGIVLIDLPISPAIDQADGLAPMTALTGIKMTPLGVHPADPPPLLDFGISIFNEETESADDSDSGDGKEHARLAGIYSGQMKARVERLWRKPRSPVSESSDVVKAKNLLGYFQCQVQIVQDAQGNVQEVLLPRCNGSVAWQHSLVVAIQEASPLPAPPDPTVFSRTVTLNFEGDP